MYPVIKIHSKGLELLGQSAQIPIGGTTFELKIDSNGKWIQRNSTTGKEIKLLLPWEIDPHKFHKDERFDDLKDALNKFRMS